MRPHDEMDAAGARRTLRASETIAGKDD